MPRLGFYYRHRAILRWFDNLDYCCIVVGYFPILVIVVECFVIWGLVVGYFMVWFFNFFDAILAIVEHLIGRNPCRRRVPSDKVMFVSTCRAEEALMLIQIIDVEDSKWRKMKV